MTTIAAGKKFDFRIGEGREGMYEGVAVAAEAPNENGWFQAHDLDGGEWILHETHISEIYQEEDEVETTKLTPEFIATRLRAFAADAKKAKKNAPEAVVEEAMRLMAAMWQEGFTAGQTHGLQAAFENAFAEVPANPFS
jgi:hypothetical protein